MQTAFTVGTIRYDGLGRRVSKAISNSANWNGTYRYYYSGQSVVEERNSSDKTLRQYVWGTQYTDELVQIGINDDPGDTEQNCETFYYAMQDANYNVLGIVNSSGDLKERYEYTPYGQRTVYKSAGGNDLTVSRICTRPIHRTSVATPDEPADEVPGALRTPKQPYRRKQMDEDLRKDARELVIHVRRVRVGYTRYMMRDLERLGLSMSQYTALAILAEKGEMTMSAISEDLGVTMGAGTNLIDKLIHSGYASRERGTSDRRVVAVRITDNGRKALERVVEWATDYLGFYMARVDPEERKSFVRSYGKMAEQITSVPFDPSASG